MKASQLAAGRKPLSEAGRARGSSGQSTGGDGRFVRVVRFTDMTAERVESLVARIDETGAPPGVPIKKLRVVLDEAQGTAVGLQYFDTCAHPAS